MNDDDALVTCVHIMSDWLDCGGEYIEFELHLLQRLGPIRKWWLGKSVSARTYVQVAESPHEN